MDERNKVMITYCNRLCTLRYPLDQKAVQLDTQHLARKKSRQQLCKMHITRLRREYRDAVMHDPSAADAAKARYLEQKATVRAKCKRDLVVLDAAKEQATAALAQQIDAVVAQNKATCDRELARLDHEAQRQELEAQHAQERQEELNRYTSWVSANVAKCIDMPFLHDLQAKCTRTMDQLHEASGCPDKAVYQELLDKQYAHLAIIQGLVAQRGWFVEQQVAVQYVHDAKFVASAKQLMSHPSIPE